MMLRSAYSVLSSLAGPFLKVWLKIRAQRGKEIANRIPERFGIAREVRPSGRLAWVHAASVGESLSVLPLIKALNAHGWRCVITTGTVTSAELLKDRLPSNAIHQFAPLDRRVWVERFYDHWHPDLILWTESELWPNTLTTITTRGTPAILVNGRLSDRAYNGWHRRKAWAGHLLASFSTILTQSDEDARRFETLGGRNVHTVGNLKYSGDVLPADTEKLNALRSEIISRPVWLAASIHPGEETAIALAHKITQRSHPDILTIVVPRHPDRAAAMVSLFSEAGLKVAQRSKGDPIAASTDIYLADTMGEMGVFYTACDIVFIGKSLAVGGGQNPVEPVQLGGAVLFGPSMANFRDISTELLECGAAGEVKDGQELGAAIIRLLDDEGAREAMIEAGRQTLTRNREAVSETLKHLEPYLGHSLS